MCESTFKASIHTVPVLLFALSAALSFSVRVCNCTELGYCYMEPGTHAWKFSVSTTVAILGGVFGFISKITDIH